MLEFNAGMILAIAGLLSLLGKWRNAPAAAALAVLVAATPAAFGFIRQAWKVQPHTADPSQTVVYQLAGWLNRHAGGARIMASGESDPELFLWSDVPQVGGPGQGVSNYLAFAAQRQIAFGCGSDSERLAELWMHAFGIRYVAIHGAESKEYFHWWAQPEKFAGLPVAWDNGGGDIVYRAPAVRRGRRGGRRSAGDGSAAAPDVDRRFPRSCRSTSPGPPVSVPQVCDGVRATALRSMPSWVRTKRCSSGRITTGVGMCMAGVPVAIHRFPAARGPAGRRGFALRSARHGTSGWAGESRCGRRPLLFFRVSNFRVAFLAVIPAMIAFGVLYCTAPATAKVARRRFDGCSRR
ncbi:MAG: hypothetical protein WDO73_13545 [Ignavibacteriota bacterium]